MSKDIMNKNLRISLSLGQKIIKSVVQLSEKSNTDQEKLFYLYA